MAVVVLSLALGLYFYLVVYLLWSQLTETKEKNTGRTDWRTQMKVQGKRVSENANGHCRQVQLLERLLFLRAVWFSLCRWTTADDNARQRGRRQFHNEIVEETPRAFDRGRDGVAETTT